MANIGVATGQISGFAVVDVDMKNGKGSIAIPQNAKYEIDPHGWVLKAQ